MLHKVIIIAKFCFDYTVMCLHMPAKNTPLTFIFVMVLITVIGLFSFMMNLVLYCGVSVYLLVICVQLIGLCLVCVLLLTLIFRWEKFLNVLFFFSRVSLTSHI